MNKPSATGMIVDVKQLRSFGLVVGGVFLLIGFWPNLRHGADARTWAVAVAVMMVIPALVAPALLRQVYAAWMAGGEALGRINTRIILGCAFYIVMTPIGVLLRLLGHDPMRRNFEDAAVSYRVAKEIRTAGHLKKPF